MPDLIVDVFASNLSITGSGIVNLCQITARGGNSHLWERVHCPVTGIMHTTAVQLRKKKTEHNKPTSTSGNMLYNYYSYYSETITYATPLWNYGACLSLAEIIVINTLGTHNMVHIYLFWLLIDCR